MRKLKGTILFLAVSFLTACATTHTPTAVPPLRDADLYPNVQSIAGLSIAVDEISNPDRVRQYFGMDLTGEDILPVNIVVTNRSEDPFVVKPSDVLLLAGDSVLDPAAPDSIPKIARGRLTDLGMHEMVVAPKETYQGMLLFKTSKKAPGLYGKVEKIFSDKLALRIAATDKTTGERLLFGPFPLSGL